MRSAPNAHPTRWTAATVITILKKQEYMGWCVLNKTTNRAIAVTNQQLGMLRARINKIKEWVYAQPIQDAPTIGEMMSAINRGQDMKSHWKKFQFYSSSSSFGS